MKLWSNISSLFFIFRSDNFYNFIIIRHSYPLVTDIKETHKQQIYKEQDYMNAPTLVILSLATFQCIWWNIVLCEEALFVIPHSNIQLLSKVSSCPICRSQIPHSFVVQWYKYCTPWKRVHLYIYTHQLMSHIISKK